jgi:L-arabinose isomerase
MLTRQGIACPVEADVKTAIALTLMKSLAGSATLTELYSMDFNQDLCIVGHSGAGDPDIADEKSLLKMSAVFHGKPGSGFLTQFTPATGPVTLASVTQGADGQYMLVLAEGELVEGRTLQLGDTNALFRFRKGLRAFVDDWSACGPTHHCAMGRGHHAQAFHKLGQLLRIPVHEV